MSDDQIDFQWVVEVTTVKRTILTDFLVALAFTGRVVLPLPDLVLEGGE